MSKYYSTQRPISIGTYPKPQGNPVIELHNFDRRQYVQEIGREAWGWITYMQPLSEQDMKSYELVAAGDEKQPEYEYSLTIMGSRRSYQKFSTLEELRREVKSLFSESDQHIADYLTTFHDEDWEEQAGAGWSEGCWTQKKEWRHYTVIATRWEDEA